MRAAQAVTSANPPTASISIFTDDATPTRDRGTRSRMSAIPGPYAMFRLAWMNIQAANSAATLGDSTRNIRLPQTTTVPNMMNGTRRPRGDRVRSLSRPISGWITAATSSPPIPSIARYEFFRLSGASERTMTGRTAVSIAVMNPVTPKLNALSRISEKTPQLASAGVRAI